MDIIATTLFINSILTKMCVCNGNCIIIILAVQMLGERIKDWENSVKMERTETYLGSWGSHQLQSCRMD